MNVTGLIWRPEDWNSFLAELQRIKGENLNDDEAWHRIELAWAPLFEGLLEDDAAAVCEACLHAVVRAGLAPPEHAPPI